MATPQQHVYTDPTVGMELTTGDEIALEATRWIFTPGDYLDPARKDDLPHLKRGGDELGNFCLRRTNGYLPRCTFTPLEVWAEWLPIEFFPEGARPLKLKGQQVEDGNPNGKTFIAKPLFGYPHYPGDLVADALGTTSTGERRGTVEIEVLRGVEVGNPAATKLADLFWPEGFEPPLQLRLVEEHIQKVAEAHKSDDVRRAANTQLLGCEQFRRWATAKIDIAHTQLDARQVHQHVYSYSPMVRSLLAQLEIKPRQQQQQDLTTELIKVVSNSGLTPELLAQMQERDNNLIANLGALFADTLATALKGVQPKPPAK